MDKRLGACFGLFTGDAIAMPVDMYLDLRQMRLDYGILKSYVSPIDKERLCTQDNDYPSDCYDTNAKSAKNESVSQGVGENTLEAQIARVFIRCLGENPPDLSGRNGDVPNPCLSSYVSFTTANGIQHEKTLSEVHRTFLANSATGKQLRCTESVNSMDILTLTIPVTVLFAHLPTSTRHAFVLDMLRCIRKTSPRTDRIVLVYSDMLSNILKGASLEREIQYAGHVVYGQSYSVRAQVAAANASNRPDPCVSGHINLAFAALLFFAMKYGINPFEEPIETSLLASANAGGGSAARGAALGALLGAAYGLEGIPHWMMIGLAHGKEIWEEVHSSLAACVVVQEGPQSCVNVI